MFRTDPGPCLICGAPHCTCGDLPTVITQLPMRDAAAAKADVDLQPTRTPEVTGAHEAAVEEISEPFTTATYRGRDKRGRVVTTPRKA